MPADRVPTLGSDARIAFNYSIDFARRVRSSPFPSANERSKKEGREKERRSGGENNEGELERAKGRFSGKRRGRRRTNETSSPSLRSEGAVDMCGLRMDELRGR